MSLRKHLENWQAGWAERKGICIGAPPGKPASRAMGYVSKLHDNLFDPLSERAKQQFIAGAGANSMRPTGRAATCMRSILPRLFALTSFTPGPGF